MGQAIERFSAVSTPVVENKNSWTGYAAAVGGYLVGVNSWQDDSAAIFIYVPEYLPEIRFLYVEDRKICCGLNDNCVRFQGSTFCVAGNTAGESVETLAGYLGMESVCANESDVERLGLGEYIAMRNGFGRNYLILPSGLWGLAADRHWNRTTKTICAPLQGCPHRKKAAAAARRTKQAKATHDRQLEEDIFRSIVNKKLLNGV